MVELGVVLVVDVMVALMAGLMVGLMAEGRSEVFAQTSPKL